MDKNKKIKNLQEEIQSLNAQVEYLRNRQTYEREQSERKYKNLFMHAPLGIFTASTEGKMLKVNNRLLEILGSPSVSETKKINLLKYQPLADVGFVEKFNQCIRTKKIIEGEGCYKSKWGNRKYLRYSLHYLEENFVNDTNGIVQCIISDITDEHLNRKSLKESEQKFKNLANLTFEGILLMKDGIIIETNDAICDFTGYSRAELLNKPAIEVFFDKPQANIAQKNIIKEYAEPYKIHARRKDGTYFPVEIEAKNINQNSGEIIRVAAVRDLSQRESSEKNISRLTVAVEQSANAVVITDTKGNIEYVNPKFAEVTGYTREEVIGKNQRIFKSGIHKQEFYKNLWDTITAGKTWKGEFHNRAKDGSLFHEQATISPVKDKSGTIINYLAVKENITELKQNEQRLQTLINNSPDAIFFKDGKGRWLEVNKAGIELFRLQNIDFKGKTDLELAELGTFYSEAFELCYQSDEEAWKKGETTYITEVIPTPEGEEYIFDVVKVPIYNADGSRQGLVIIGRDVTERQKAADVLQKKSDEFYSLYEEHKNLNNDLINAIERAEMSDKLKNEFLHNMSHEIRTPLNGIMGFAQLLDNPDLNYEKQKNYTGIIINSSRQLMRIIDDILEVSKLETKQSNIRKREICLNDLLVNILSDYDDFAKQQQVPLYLHKELSDNESLIVSDEFKIRKIVSHLIDNALKFTHKGYVEFGYSLSSEHLKIYVKDTGIGINPEKQQKIFERFSQEDDDLDRSYGGLGLGLSIAKENAELLGGTISLESEKNKGSVFYFEMPADAPNAPKNTETKSGQIASGNGAQKTHTILIAEDEEINYLYLETLIADFSEKINIVHKKNGQEAVDYFNNNGKEVDLVLMDIKMPVKDGYQATKELKKKFPMLTIIVQIAYSTGDDKLKAQLAGADDFLSKPIDNKDVISLLNKYIK